MWCGVVWCGVVWAEVGVCAKKGVGCLFEGFFFGWCCVRATERARRRHEDRLSGFTSTAVNFLSRKEPMRARERDRERLDRALAGPPLCVVLAVVNTTTRARAAPQKTKHKQAASLLASRPPRPQSYSSRACVCVRANWQPIGVVLGVAKAPPIKAAFGPLWRERESMHSPSFPAHAAPKHAQTELEQRLLLFIAHNSLPPRETTSCSGRRRRRATLSPRSERPCPCLSLSRFFR